MKIVTIAGVDVPIVDGDIGIALSGGADSALLLYILMNNVGNDANIHIHTFCKPATFYNAALITPPIIEFCINKTLFANIKHVVYYIKEQTHDVLYQDFLTKVQKGEIQRFYSAVTANPPLDIADSFCGVQHNVCHIDRDPLTYRDIFRGQHSITPFTNIDKKKIAEMYRTLNVEQLFNMTCSCENVLEETKINHCGSCWWCCERNWGFNNE